MSLVIKVFSSFIAEQAKPHPAVQDKQIFLLGI